MAEVAEGGDALIALSAALATRDDIRIDDALTRAACASSAQAIEEVILQSHLFLGFPTTLGAMARWRALGERSAALVEGENEGSWKSRGERLCEIVYASNYDRLRERVAALHPDLDLWMVTGGYGRVLARPGLDLVTRELCIVALLTVWDAPDQLHSHLRGALNAGATTAQVDRTVEIAALHASDGATARARERWARVRSRNASVAG